HHQVGVSVVDAENKSLLARRGVEFLRQEFAHDAVEGFGNDFAVKVLNIQLDLVGGGEEIELVAVHVIHLHLFSYLPDDAGGGEFGIDLHRRLVINEIAVDDGLAIAVGKDGRTEDLRGVQGWRGGEADLHRVEIVEHAAVLGDVVVVAAETQLRIRQLAVEQVTAMAFVNHNAV